MITSTLGRMSDADKLSVQQLKQAVQNGTVPAYIGIPLLQEKLKQSQQLQAAQAAQAPKQPPIADQILQQAQGIPELPSNLPTQYAHGGIIHMAMGGYDPMAMARSFVRDDEDTDDLDYLGTLGSVGEIPEHTESEQAPETAMPQSMSSFMPETQAAPDEGGIADLVPLKALAVAAPFSTSREVKQVTAKEEGRPAETIRKETARVERPAAARDLERLALAEAEKYRLDPSLVKHVMFKETGSVKDKINAVSPAGAMGVMQLMPGTARDMGVKDPYDPIQNIEGGVKYLAKMQRKYDDPKLAAIAYNWGPGNTDRWLAQGGDFAKLPRETQGYIRGLAEGGSVKHFDKGGTTANGDGSSLLDTLFPPLANGKPNPIREALRFKTYQPEPNTVEAEGMTYNIVTPQKNAPPAPPPVGPYTDERTRLLRRYPNLGSGRGPASPEQFNPAEDIAGKTKEYVPPETPAYKEVEHLAKLYPPTGQLSTNATDIPPVEQEEKAETAAPEKDELREYFSKGIAGLEDQKKINAYMALLSAGLGMMGGTSPHALTNIGAGAQQGVQTYLTGNKDIAAQQNALMQNRLGLEKYQSLRDIQKQQMQNLKEYRENEAQRKIDAANQTAALRAQGIESSTLARAEKLMEIQRKNFETSEIAAVQSKWKGNFSLQTPEGRAEYEADIDAAKNRAHLKLMQDPTYRTIHKRVIGVDPVDLMPSAAAAQQSKPAVQNW